MGTVDAIQRQNFSSFSCFATLLKKEMLRIWAVAGQTLLAPVVTATLYLLIFGVSLGSRISFWEDISYIQFVVPGLALMAVINNAFANTSSSLFISKYLGNIADLLVTPLTPFQFMLAYSIAAIIRALAVCAVILLVSIFFTGMPWAFPVRAFAMALVSAFLFAQFGLISAIYAKSFDSLSVFTNFLLMPLIYLGGLFYPVQQLPSPWNTISMFNPLYYLIEGFRSSILGRGEISFAIAFGVSTAIAAALCWSVIYLFKNSPRLRN
ncbi:ABC transporter permease [bacterium]|nr:ABC transporter permease [bacterium]